MYRQGTLHRRLNCNNDAGYSLILPTWKGPVLKKGSGGYWGGCQEIFIVIPLPPSNGAKHPPASRTLSEST